MLKENIMEGVEFLRDRTILVAESSIEDRPKMLEEAKISSNQSDVELKKLLEQSNLTLV